MSGSTPICYNRVSSKSLLTTRGCTIVPLYLCTCRISGLVTCSAAPGGVVIHILRRLLVGELRVRPSRASRQLVAGLASQTDERSFSSSSIPKPLAPFIGAVKILTVHTSFSSIKPSGKPSGSVLTYGPVEGTGSRRTGFHRRESCNNAENHPWVCTAGLWLG